MNKNKIYNISLLLTVAVFFLTSCKRELDVAPIATYDGQATHTIAQLLEFHPITAGFTYDTLPKGIVIQGVVISSDKDGNCYKYITIDDGTAGVQIKINSTNLYMNYPLGQRIFVECDGLVLGDYGMLPQLGWWENDGMVGINSDVLYKTIYRHGEPGPTPEPIELTSANQIQENMYNRLVCIKNCHFKYPGEVFASNSSSGTSKDIVFEDGSSIVLYTSRYAKFASELTPAGTFDMVAILSRFRTTNQLTLRSLSDMTTPFVPTVPTEVVVSSMDLSQNPLDNGWINKTLAGSNWEYMQGNAMKIMGAAGNNDSWLISPAVNATGYDNLKLSFTHRSLNGTANREVYYSTTYTGGDINESEWHSLNVNNFTTSFTTYAVTLPEELLSATNLRFAFRYRDNTNSTWLLSEYKVYTIVEQ
jgi:hypothetical protein